MCNSMPLPSIWQPNRVVGLGLSLVMSLEFLFLRALLYPMSIFFSAISATSSVSSVITSRCVWSSVFSVEGALYKDTHR